MVRYKWTGFYGAVVLMMTILVTNAYATETNKWVFDYRYNIAGIKQTLPTVEKKECLGKKTPLPDISRPGYVCKAGRHAWFGRTLVWQVDCSNDWESIQGTGRLHFDKERASGDIHLQIINPTGTPQYMVLNIDGKQLGSCS